MAKYKTVTVQVPEITQLPLDPAQVAQLDSLCSAYRTVQGEVAALEKTKKAVAEELKPLAEGMGLPERVLGETWDLRRTVRESSRVNEDRLRTWLLNLGISVKVECPKVVEVEVDGTVVLDLCPRCQGAGFITLTSIDAANHIVQDCTDTSSSTSWSVYGRDKAKENS